MNHLKKMFGWKRDLKFRFYNLTARIGKAVVKKSVKEMDLILSLHYGTEFPPSESLDGRRIEWINTMVELPDGKITYLFQDLRWCKCGKRKRHGGDNCYECSGEPA